MVKGFEGFKKDLRREDRKAISIPELVLCKTILVQVWIQRFAMADYFEEHF